MSNRARYVAALAALATAAGSGGCGGSAPGTSGQPTSSNASIAAAASPPTKLNATVGVEGQVTLTTPNGHAITRLPNGFYTILVRVNSTAADFHLTGPNVQRATREHVASLAIWGVQLLKGTYHYLNDLDPRATTHVITVY
jgi:hypothetical protein